MCFTISADCASGSEYNFITQVCDTCLRGYYRDRNDKLQMDCQLCDVNFITLGTGSTSVSDCSVSEYCKHTSSTTCTVWAASSEFVSSSIPSLQILTAHAQPFRGARDLAICLKVPLDSLLVWASSEGSGETAQMRRLAWTFADRIGDKYQIRLTRSV